MLICEQDRLRPENNQPIFKLENPSGFVGRIANSPSGIATTGTKCRVVHTVSFASTPEKRESRENERIVRTPPLVRFMSYNTRVGRRRSTTLLPSRYLPPLRDLNPLEAAVSPERRYRAESAMLVGSCRWKGGITISNCGLP